MGSSGFGFGIETEYLLVRQTYDEKSKSEKVTPLWIYDLNAEDLMDITDGIDTRDFNLDGLNQKPLHKSPCTKVSTTTSSKATRYLMKT